MNQPAIHLAETLAVGSIEGFLTPAEVSQLDALMTEHLRTTGGDRFGAGRTESIHEIPGHTAAEAMAFYEPAGRIEVRELPADAEALLQGGFQRAREALSRALPSVTLCRPWAYVEYGPGQHITAHLDGIAPNPVSWPRQIAGISVVITEAEHGGRFQVETSADPCLWTELATGPGDGYAPGMRFARDGADRSAPWFTAAQRTAWTAEPAPGTALLYGSQLAHATTPVLAGRSRKFISWLAAA
jgi:hypothetical protein